MTIKSRAPPTAPAITPPMLLVLGLGGVDCEGDGVTVVVGEPEDERNPVERIIILGSGDTCLVRTLVTLDVDVDVSSDE